MLHWGGFWAAPDCEICPEKRERFSARETRDRKWCQWPRRQGGRNGRGTQDDVCVFVCVFVCVCVCVFACCVISCSTSHALSLPSNKTFRLCVTVCFLAHPSCHISGIESCRRCFCITTTELGQQLIKTYIIDERELINGQAKLVHLVLFFHQHNWSIKISCWCVFDQCCWCCWKPAPVASPLQPFACCRIVSKGSLCTHLCLYRWIAFALFMCTRVPADGGQSSDPGLGALSTAFIITLLTCCANCSHLLYHLHVHCPIRACSLYWKPYKKATMNAKATSCRILNKLLLRSFSENKGDEKV